MHEATTRTVDVYLRVKSLPRPLWPAHVVREDGTTLVTVDPSSTRAEIAMWSPDHLTVDEMNAYRWAYGQPLVGFPLDEWWMTDECFPPVVPDPVRVPSEALVERSKQARTASAVLLSQLARYQRRSSA